MKNVPHAYILDNDKLHSLAFRHSMSYSVTKLFSWVEFVQRQKRLAVTLSVSATELSKLKVTSHPRRWIISTKIISESILGSDNMCRSLLTVISVVFNRLDNSQKTMLSVIVCHFCSLVAADTSHILLWPGWQNKASQRAIKKINTVKAQYRFRHNIWRQSQVTQGIPFFWHHTGSVTVSAGNGVVNFSVLFVCW